MRPVMIVFMESNDEADDAKVYLDPGANANRVAAVVLRAALQKGATVAEVLSLCADSVAEVA